MTHSTFAMSGLLTLAVNQVELLESLGLVVPSVVTGPALTSMLVMARAAAAAQQHPVFTPLITQALDDMQALASRLA